jgi:hypothetical protein
MQSTQLWARHGDVRLIAVAISALVLDDVLLDPLLEIVVDRVSADLRVFTKVR